MQEHLHTLKELSLILPTEIEMFSIEQLTHWLEEELILYRQTSNPARLALLCLTISTKWMAHSLTSSLVTPEELTEIEHNTKEKFPIDVCSN